MTRPWFPPVPILEVGRAVERAVKNAPKSRRRKPSKSERLFERSSKATHSERMRFHEQVDALVGGRFAIRLINGRYEIWDADSHDVFGNYRTYDDAYHAAEKLL
jgi:hypothetical protein